MNNTLKIIFYGTPSFATGVLQQIHESQHRIVGVVTAPDKPSGRGQQLQTSDVKQYAMQHSLNLLQPTNLKDPKFIEAIKALQADVQVIVAFRMLPRVVWEMPPMGTFNLHASLLPQYRGAAPINWAIVNNETETGVTTFFIDDQIDTGAIIDQEKCSIEPEENVGTLYEKLMKLGAQLSLKTLNSIASNTVTTRIQKNDTHLKEAPKLNNENTTINFDNEAVVVDAMVRGFNPFPIAKAVLYEDDDKAQTLKIFKTTVIDENHKCIVGTLIIKDSNIRVACKKGFIQIDELQLPNKKRLLSRELLNGYRFSANARFYKD